ncbi:MAG: hypothetical protein ACI9WO_001772 [Sphingobacteriales bacterium]|jgi:hypothetical protein
MNGEVETESLADSQDLLEVYPDVNRINIQECGGSGDDDANLELSKLVYNQTMTTHIMVNGLVASGGTNFFLAGRGRSMEDGAMIGVHSWSSGSTEDSSFLRGHADHQPYIDYYKTIGFTQKEAEDFCYFTVNAAKSSRRHYMTQEEIQLYKILK